MIGPSLGQVWM